MRRFVFEFSNRDTDDLVNYFFTLDGPADLFKSSREGGYNDESEDHLFFVGDMEEYGVHDYGTSGSEEFIGYYSYEIDPTNWDVVIEKWREFLASRGFTVGEAIRLPADEYKARFFS